ERHREKVMSGATRDRIIALARGEIARCWRREGPYRSAVSGLLLGAEKALAQSVETALGRPLAESEVWIIEDMWDESFGSSGSSMKRAREWKRLRPSASDEQPDGACLRQ